MNSYAILYEFKRKPVIFQSIALEFKTCGTSGIEGLNEVFRSVT